MTPEQEQEVLRIAQEIWSRTDERDWVRDFSKELEFARRLLAERERAEPIGWFDVYKHKDGSNSYIHIKDENHDETSVQLYAAPSQDALDAKRYRIVRNHIPPRALSVALGVAWTDIPKDMEINAKCDELCDAVLRGK